MNPEEQHIRAFVASSKRERMLSLLGGDQRKRSKLVAMLPHFDAFDARFVEPMDRTGKRDEQLETTYARLRRLGAPDTCWALSLNHEIDGRRLELREALDATLGWQMATWLICNPGQLAYVEDEGKNRRFILHHT